MAANGISTLQPPSARAAAKLALAETKRQAGGNVNDEAYRELNELGTNLPWPTQGRPWVKSDGTSDGPAQT